jgi:hypothetical protein
VAAPAFEIAAIVIKTSHFSIFHYENLKFFIRHLRISTWKCNTSRVVFIQKHGLGAKGQQGQRNRTAVATGQTLNLGKAAIHIHLRNSSDVAKKAKK